MNINHLAVDDCVLVRFALTKNLCSNNDVDIWLRSENIRRSSLPYVPTPPNSRELGRNSALSAHAKKVDKNDHKLLKFNNFSI
jgi:hypothetical protein